jgi:hypothetical protein
MAVGTVRVGPEGAIGAEGTAGASAGADTPLLFAEVGIGDCEVGTAPGGKDAPVATGVEAGAAPGIVGTPPAGVIVATAPLKLPNATRDTRTVRGNESFMVEVL